MTALVAGQPKAPVEAAQRPAPIEDSFCKKTIQAITQIAIHVLVPLAAALFLYIALPLNVSLIVLPIATLATVVAMTFFFSPAKKADPVLPLSATAPSGLRNSGADCWINSLAQIMRIDAGMKKWFTEVPNQLDTHVSYFRHFSQELLENLPDVLPAEVYVDLAPGDAAGRAKIDRYANWIRNRPIPVKENLFRYLQFLRQFPLVMNPAVQPQQVARSLLEFKKFMTSYDGSEPGKHVTLPDNRPAPAPQEAAKAPAQPREPEAYDSHGLRLAIARIFPDIAANHSQQDPAVGLGGLDLLLPDELKVLSRQSKYYDIRGKEPLRPEDAAAGAETIDGSIIVQAETSVGIPRMSASMEGSFPNVRNFVERFLDTPNRFPEEGGINRLSHGVLTYYPFLRTKTQYLTAPESLWIHIKRFRRIEPQWAGLHRMMPNLFPAKPADQVKNENDVEVQDTLEIQPVNGPLARYKLDGFIVHLGVDNGGHYVSYTLGEDDDHNPAWFKMDDSRVTRISDDQMRAALKKAYIPHYSKIVE